MRLASWSIAVLLTLAPASFAQPTPQTVPLQTTSGTGFTGAPYSGKETTVKVQMLTDGTKTTTTFVEYVWRDAEGRTRRELIRNDNSGAQYRSVIITDPVAGYARPASDSPAGLRPANTPEPCRNGLDARLSA